MVITCSIIDDEPLAIELLKSYVVKTPFLQLKGTYTSAVTAINDFSKEMPDLLFLDIQMPDINGLEISKMFTDKCKIIFTTAFENYALDSYKVNALDYLLKPISYIDFLKSANKALSVLSANTGNNVAPVQKKSIIVKSDYKLIQIDFDRILYIEGIKDYVKIVLDNDLKPILTLMSMKGLEDELPSDQFIRVHRSFIVQPSKIVMIERNRIVFGKLYIPISDTYKDNFQEYLNNHTIKGYRK